MSEKRTDRHGLTSPRTVPDPQDEDRRADDAVERELESRWSPETKYEKQRREQMRERGEHAKNLSDES